MLTNRIGCGRLSCLSGLVLAHPPFAESVVKYRGAVDLSRMGCGTIGRKPFFRRLCSDANRD